ncbi:MAG: 4-demethylwyosine synthase TYW1 [Candidatus Diapherotrites archaeon]|nr:4-demethylwyosine synthase TYW1 [Candidatus Diapherotrites archaeon]
MISESLRKELTHQHYRLAGAHSAVKLCHWTKHSLLENRYCYKQKFYGIQSHRCLQMTPAIAWCNQRCLYCWRTHKLVTPDIKWDDPETVIEESIKAQRVLLTGYYGLLDRVDKAKLEEAMNPNQVAISLAGEPTLYPYLSGLIEAFTKRDFSTFLVTNGLRPQVLAELALPTQLYVSLSAPNEEIHKKLNVPMIPNSWKLLNETLKLFPSLDTRKVIRITLVKGWNDVHPELYAKLISKASPDFIEVKAYMFVGDSRRRMTIANMPRHGEVVAFTRLLENELPDYKLIDEKEDSRVVLLSNGRKTSLIGEAEKHEQKTKEY